MTESSKDRAVGGENLLNMPEFQPKNVNVHQFYPELAHNFDQHSTKFEKHAKEPKSIEPSEEGEEEEQEEQEESGPLVKVEADDNNSADKDAQVSLCIFVL